MGSAEITADHDIRPAAAADVAQVVAAVTARRGRYSLGDLRVACAGTSRSTAESAMRRNCARG